jgi:hypothetical protein
LSGGLSGDNGRWGRCRLLLAARDDGGQHRHRRDAEQRARLRNRN